MTIINLETSKCSLCDALNCNFVSRCGHTFHLSCFKRLNRCDNEGNNTLHLAALGGQRGNVEDLIQDGMDVSLKNKSGKTALDLASEAGHENVVRVLREFDLTQ